MDLVLAEIESDQRKTIFIFTDSAKEMSAFFGYSKSVRSGVPHTISLPDYSDAELLAFFKILMD